MKNYEFCGFVDKVYKNSKSKFYIKCLFHKHIWIASYDNFIRKDSNCIICNESKGEKLIAEILEKKQIKFIRQKKFDKCKNKRLLPFDFYIKAHNLCIEYDGIQHYEPIDRFGGIYEFKKLNKNDIIKTKYCVDNNINLLRISYKDNIIEKLNHHLLLMIT